ncbi:MAG TPA: hypothetical protein VL972_05880 [Solirubrobacteraceae bacterium]|nr:hypothetical protein [Solirubrobacteraceae bacterium]
MRKGLTCAFTACVLLGAWLPGACLARESAKLHVSLQPERLGAGTTILFGFSLAANPAGGVPSPLRQIDLRYPGDLGFATSGLGLESCTATTLETAGPGDCPANSRMGYGSAIVVVPFGGQLIDEHATIATFMAPLSEGQISLLYDAQGTTPLLANLVFPAALAPGPAGGSLQTELPLVPTLPAAPDVAVVQLTSTIGPAHILYRRRGHGHTISYTPKGVVLPRGCPHGGFRFAAQFAFADGTRASATARVACPRRA